MGFFKNVLNFSFYKITEFFETFTSTESRNFIKRRQALRFCKITKCYEQTC